MSNETFVIGETVKVSNPASVRYGHTATVAMHGHYGSIFLKFAGSPEQHFYNTEEIEKIVSVEEDPVVFAILEEMDKTIEQAEKSLATIKAVRDAIAGVRV